MIYRPARAIAATLIERFRTGEISFDQMEIEWPRSSDIALHEISACLWKEFYGDLSPVIVGRTKHASTEELGLLDRCASFLRTDRPYEWPERRRSLLRELVDWLRPGGNTTGQQPVTSLRVASVGRGDPSVWPFFRPDDYRPG